MIRLCLEQVSAGYSRAPVLRDVHLRVGAGDFIGVIGRNGCGKSTLLKVMAGLLSPRRGTVCIGGTTLPQLSRAQLARRLALLPQHPSAPPETTVRELVAYGRVPHARWYRPLSPADLEIIGHALARCGLEGFADRPLGQLSGGERQRAWIAMALAQQTPILLLDEPLSFLDINHQLEVMELLRDINRRDGLSLVVVMHDINLAGRYCQRLVTMRAGHIVHDGPAEAVLTDAHLADVFHVHARVERDHADGCLTCRFYAARPGAHTPASAGPSEEVLATG